MRQSPLVPLGSLALVLRVRVKNPPTRAAVQVALHDPTPSSLAFSDAIQRGELKPYLEDTPVTIDLTNPLVKPAPDGSVQLVYPLQRPGQRPLEETLKLINTGVYALDVRLVHCGYCQPLVTGTPLVRCVQKCPIVDSFVTWVVAVHGPAPSGVDVSWVWQVASPPLGVDGSIPVETRDAFSDHGRLSRVTAALRAAGSLPITIAPSGETLQAWRATAAHDAGAADSFGAFTAAIARAHPDVVLAPWVPIDERLLHEAGAAESVRADFQLEAPAVRAAIHVTPDRSTAWLDHADAQTLATLRSLGVEQVGVRDAELQPIDAALQHQRGSVAGSPLGVLSDDSFLTTLLRGTDSPALRVQRFVAATALLASDNPNRRAGVVLATTSLWEPDQALVAYFARTVALDPLLHMTSLDDAFTDVTAGTDGHGGPLVRQFAPRQLDAFAVPRSSINATSGAVDAFASLLVDGKDLRLSTARTSLLIAMSALVGHDDAQARLDAINTMVSNFTHSISASARSVTLTSAQTSIPITFTNHTGTAVQIRVRLLSDKIDQPEGGSKVTLPAAPANQTVPIDVRVRTSGHFDVMIQMQSIVGGLLVGQPERVTVTSRVFGSWGTWLTYGALLFLALWWAHHFLRRRRKVVEA